MHIAVILFLMLCINPLTLGGSTPEVNKGFLSLSLPTLPSAVILINFTVPGLRNVVVGG